MRLFIGANSTSSIRHAGDWIRNDRILKQLESWGRAREADWGACHVFLEVSIPTDAGGALNQIDLLVAFDTRVALCEIKRHDKLISVNLQEVVDQVDRQHDTFRHLLRRDGFQQGFARIVFFPNLSDNDLRSARSQLRSVHSRSDIRVAGALGSRSIPNVLERLGFDLTEYEAGRSRNGLGAQEWLRGLLQREPRSLRQFNSASDLLDFLRAIYRVPDLHFPEAFVPSTHKKELQELREALLNSRAVELCGPPEIGKSILTCEAIGELRRPVREIHIPKLESVPEIAAYLEGRLEGGADPLISSSALIERLVSEDIIWWIRSYDAGSRNCVAGLLEMVLAKRQGKPSLWLIESRIPLAVRGLKTIQLGPMERNQLARILIRHQGGTASGEIERALDGSYGNPGQALRLLHADAGPAEEVGSYSWFVQRMSRAERRILWIICFALSRAPFGLTKELIDRIVQDAVSDLTQGDKRRGAQKVLDSLQACQLAHVTVFNASRFGGTVDNLIPEETNFVIVNSVDPGLLAAAAHEMTEERRERWKDAMNSALITSAAPGNLADVTFHLLDRNLEPYFRSSFRFTALGRLVTDWIETFNWDPPNNRQAYLLKALRVLVALNRDRSTDVQNELQGPDPNDQACKFAYQFVVAREMTVRDLPSTFRLEDFCERTSIVSDLDLRAALYVSCSTALQNVDRNLEALGMLLDAAKNLPAETSAGAVLRFQIGDVLNTKEGKLAAVQLGHEELNQTNARELLCAGLALSNLHMVCAAMFYSVRGKEFAVARTSPGAVLPYLVALDWIEHVPGARTRWRIRALLTRGSIHRHCLREGVPWEDFQLHLGLAWDDYTRAWMAASTFRHARHSYNAVIYMAGLCKSGMSYFENEKARSSVIDYCRSALDMCTSTLSELSAIGPRDRDLRENATLAEPLLRYALAVAGEEESMSCEALRSQWDNYAALVITRRGKWNRKSKSPDEGSCGELYRLFSFSKRLNPAKHSELLRCVIPSIEKLIRIWSLRRHFPGLRRLEGVLREK